MTSDWYCVVKNMPIIIIYIGRRAEHDMNGSIIMVISRERRLSMVLVAMMAGTLQPKPITKGMNDFPWSPIPCISLSMMKAARAIYPESSISEMKK